MTAGEFALQVAAIGGQQVGAVALRTVSVVVVAAAVLALVYAVRGQLRAYPDRYERPAPLIADAPEGHGCPWCDDRACIDSSLCDCTGPCGRRYCMTVLGPWGDEGITTAIRQARAQGEAEADAMHAEWEKQQGDKR